jgi:hypothetical protein
MLRLRFSSEERSDFFDIWLCSFCMLVAGAALHGAPSWNTVQPFLYRPFLSLRFNWSC